MYRSIVCGDMIVFRITSKRLWNQNCYVLVHPATKQVIIIDPGDNAEQIENVVTNCQGRVSHVLLTHAHHDHVGAGEALCEKYGIPCTFHQADYRILRHAPTYAMRFSRRVISTPKQCHPFSENAFFAFGPHRVEAIFTPGHTPGSTCYYIGNLLFTGDTLTLRNIGRTDLPGGNRAALINSVNSIMESRHTYSAIILPGHGRTWRVDKARTWWETFKPGAALPNIREGV